MWRSGFYFPIDGPAWLLTKGEIIYKKILVPLDGSSLAASVLPHVQMLAEASAADIFLLQVVVDPVYDLLLSGPKLAAATRDRVPTLRVAAQIYLDCIAARFKAHDIKSRR